MKIAGGNAAFAVSLLMLAAITHAWAQGAAKKPDGDVAFGPGFDLAKAVPAPGAASERLRAFTGNWRSTRPTVGIIKPGLVPLTPKFMARHEEIAKIAVAGGEVPGNEPQCIPNGPVMGMGFGFRVFADAMQMSIITSGPRIRYVWVDGRKHTPDDYLFETYEGESVAQWDGDTLVVDTKGMKGSDEIIFGIAPDDSTMHLTERWKTLSPTTMEIVSTVEDKAMLTKPWTYRRVYSRQPLTDDLMYCVAANDRTRGGEYDLTPPPGGYIPPGAK